MLIFTVSAIMASSAEFFFTVALSETEVFTRLDSVLGIQILESRVVVLVQRMRTSNYRSPHLQRKVSLVRMWFLVIKSLHFKLCPELLRGKNFKTDLVFCSLYSKICRDLTFSSEHVHLSPPCMVTPIIYSVWQARLKVLMFLRPSGFRRYQKMVLELVTRG